MDNCFLYILVTLIIIIFAIIVSYKPEEVENYENNFWDQLGHGPRAENCYSLSNDKCLNYTNCGLCKRDPQRYECVPGDEQGPFFCLGCDNWVYSNFYDRYIFGQKITRSTPSFDRFNPGYEALLVDPITRSTLQ